MKCSVYQTLALSIYYIVSHLETMLGSLGIHNTEKEMQYICLHLGGMRLSTIRILKTTDHLLPMLS